jgi:PAS domain S-box-containing protein
MTKSAYLLNISKNLKVKTLTLASLQNRNNLLMDVTENGSIIPVSPSSSLELKVKDRSLELSETNTNLENEIKYREFAEAQLAIEKQRLADILEGTNVGTWEWNIQTGHTIFNERWAGILGYTLDEISPTSIETWAKFAHPDDLKVSGELLERHFKGESDYYSFESRMLHKNGNWIWVLDRGKVHHWDIEGKPVLMSGTHQDIDERKQSESDLEESREKYRGLSEASFEAIFFSEKGKCIEQNLAAEMMFGYTTEEALSRYGTEWIVPEDRDMVMQRMLSGIEDPYEATALKKDGTTFPCVLNGKMMFYKGRNVRVTSLTDITVRKQAQEELQSKMALLEAQKNATLDGILVIDETKERILTINKRYIEIFSVPKDIAEQESAKPLLLHAASLVKYPDNFLEVTTLLYDHPGQVNNDEIQLNNGVILERYSAPVVGIDGKSQGRIWTFHDITQRRKTEEEIIASRNEAEKANQAKSEFLSRMSHELRTPMNSILGFAQLLNMGELNPKQRKGICHILNSGQHLLNLIDEVLDISHIESGKLSFMPAPIELRGIIDEIIDIIQPLANSRQLKLEVEYFRINQLVVMSDRMRIKQVLLNLFNNAVKYNRQGGSISVKTETIHHGGDCLDAIRISISDTGIGISPDDIPKLFVPFERIGAENTKTEGTGLGLAVVKKIMDAMEGAVGVDSKVGYGSTFWIELPVAEMVTKPLDINHFLKTTDTLVGPAMAQQQINGGEKI